MDDLFLSLPLILFGFWLPICLFMIFLLVEWYSQSHFRLLQNVKQIATGVSIMLNKSVESIGKLGLPIK